MLFRSIFIVFLLTGIWHGAAWQFIVWGLWHGLFRMTEMALKRSKKEFKILSALKHLYAVAVISMGWVLFRSDSLINGVKYWGNMFGIGAAGFSNSYSLFTLKSTLGIFLIGILFCFPVAKKIRELVQKKKGLYAFGDNFLMPVLYLGLFVLCISCMLMNNYNAFIYQKF